MEFYKEKEQKGFWFQQIGNVILKSTVWINSNKWGSHFCFCQSPPKARGIEPDCMCAMLPEKTIHKQPLLLSIKQNFYTGSYSDSFNPFDFVFKQNSVYMDTINSLLTECMQVSLFHPSSYSQHLKHRCQSSFQSKPRTQLNFKAKWREVEN